MPQFENISELNCQSHSRNYVPLNSNNLEIVCVISNVLVGVNMEIGGTNTAGLVYSKNEGGTNDTLVSYNTIQNS